MTDEQNADDTESSVPKKTIPSVHDAKHAGHHRAGVAHVIEQADAGHYVFEDWAEEPVSDGNRKGMRISVTRWEADPSVEAEPHGMSFDE